ncbi:hypothetical protein LP416_02025 [Polaromonas sp. P2-4]|nr:hypothetical protein LP416_02025 [Polaromonas sp. P2-4]
MADGRRPAAAAGVRALLHQALAQAAARAQHEHRNAVQRQAQAPAQQREHRPGPVAKAVLRDGEDEQVDQHVHRRVDVPAQFGASALARDPFDLFGGQWGQGEIMRSSF